MMVMLDLSEEILPRLRAEAEHRQLSVNALIEEMQNHCQSTQNHQQSGN